MHVRLLPVALIALIALSASTACNKLKGQSADGGAGAEGGAADSPLAFLGGFEGEIDGFTKDSKGTQVPIVLDIKASKVRFEIPEHMAKGTPLGEKAYVLFDPSAKKMWVVSDVQKQAIVVDLNTSGKALQGFGPPGAHGPGAPSGPPPKVTKTGKFDTIAGYKCENWDISSDHKEGTVCVADQGASWLSIPMTGIPTEQAWMLELLDGKHFPLRFVGYAKDGTTEESHIEVTKIDKKPLADTLFQVPAGYKTIDLDKMLQGFGVPGGFPIPHIPPHH
jgi:hypothetical protein